jgi:hypothetical protein
MSPPPPAAAVGGALLPRAAFKVAAHFFRDPAQRVIKSYERRCGIRALVEGMPDASQSPTIVVQGH